MCRVEQRERSRGIRHSFAGLAHRVVAQVRGEEGVDTRGTYIVKETVAGATAHSDRTHRRVEVPRHPDPLRRRRQPVGRAAREFAQRQRVLELADPAEAAASRGVGGVRDQRADDADVERARERVGDAGVGLVGVGVRDVQRDVVLDQCVDGAALEVRGGHRRRTAQVERVVGDQQVRAELHRLVDDSLDGVDREEHPAHLGVRIPGDRADRVPSLGEGRGPEGFEGGGYFRQTGHAPRLPAPPAPPPSPA